MLMGMGQIAPKSVIISPNSEVTPAVASACNGYRDERRQRATSDLKDCSKSTAPATGARPWNVTMRRDGDFHVPALQNRLRLGRGQVSNGIYIMDQWPNMMQKPKISMRFLYRLGKDKNGKYINPPQNADAFSVIE